MYTHAASNNRKGKKTEPGRKEREESKQTRNYSEEVTSCGLLSLVRCTDEPNSVVMFNHAFIILLRFYFASVHVQVHILSITMIHNRTEIDLVLSADLDVIIKSMWCITCMYNTRRLIQSHAEEPRYKEVGYHKAWLFCWSQPALYISLFCFIPWYNDKPDITMR